MTFSIFNFLIGRQMAERQGVTESGDINRTGLISALMPGAPGIVAGSVFARRFAGDVSIGAPIPSMPGGRPKLEEPGHRLTEPMMVEVPDFAALPDLNTRRTVAQHLRLLFEETSAESDTIRQIPAAGSIVLQNTPVMLELPAPTVEVPDFLAAKDIQEMKILADKALVSLKVVEARDFYQHPSAGAKVRPAEEVIVFLPARTATREIPRTD